MDIVQIIEIIALVIGVPYMVLEVLQKNSMWYFGMVTSTACAIQFYLQSNWANMGLNIYYVLMAFWGLYQWRKDSAAVKSSEIHLSKLTPRMALLSAAVFVVGTAVLIWALTLMHDSNAWMDALSTALCVVAMFWLARSIPYHWILWIIGDAILTVMCFLGGKYWLTLLYVGYVIASSYGLYRWLKKGVYV